VFRPLSRNADIEGIRLDAPDSRQRNHGHQRFSFTAREGMSFHFAAGEAAHRDLPGAAHRNHADTESMAGCVGEWAFDDLFAVRNQSV